MRKIKPLTYDEAMQTLINGVCGSNPNDIVRETTLSRGTVRNFLEGKNIEEFSRDLIGFYIWKKMNSDVLLSPEDLEK